MELKRINYFKGLFLYADDLRTAERYRDRKHQLHNQSMHRPGIVHGYLDELAVSVDEQGTTITVERGMAIDHQGRELCRSESESIPISTADYEAPTVIYIVLHYEEKEVEFRRNVANGEYSGHAFIEELADVKVTTEEPGDEAIELARVRLGAGSTQITMPADPSEPGENELDLRYRLRAGARGRLQLQDFATLVRDTVSHVEGGDIAQIRIEEVAAGAADRDRFYTVSAYPIGQAKITWRLESSVDRGGATEYTVVLENLSQQPVDIHCRVYRID